MVYVRPSERVGCDFTPTSSALKKSGKLIQMYCWKCTKYCWIYTGDKTRWLDVYNNRK